MDLELTEEERVLKENTRRFMEREIVPLADEGDRRKILLDAATAREFIRKVAPLGYLGTTLPEEAGGAGADHFVSGILTEEIFRAWGSLGGLVGITSGVAGAVFAAGTDEHRRRYLPALLRGEILGCAAITEPNVGSNPAAAETTATLSGDHYVLTGTKTWISNGSVADVALVTAQAEKSKGKRGLIRLLVDRSESPFECRELPKLGLRSFPTSELVFSECRVPRDNLIGRAGEGLKDTLKMFEQARCWMAMGAVGLAQAALDAAVRYARERAQFGRPIGGFQLVQEMIADMATETEASRLLAYRGLRLLDRRVRCDRETSMAKAFATEAAVRVTSAAIQIHGAYGLSEEYPLERYFRDARCWTIPDGTTQIQKLIIGRAMLGMSAIA
jgi:alkylation response protein AidB-like acyl-CoA dehydrogenase